MTCTLPCFESMKDLENWNKVAFGSITEKPQAMAKKKGKRRETWTAREGREAENLLSGYGVRVASK